MISDACSIYKQAMTTRHSEPTNKHPASLAELGPSKGGKARAQNLSKGRLKEIGRDAASARWHVKATHKGILSLPAGVNGETIDLACFVLENGKRILSLNGMLAALGMQRGGNPELRGDRLSNFAGGKAINSYLSEELHARIREPIIFRANLARGAVTGRAYEATLLADLCGAVIRAKIDGALQEQQSHIAARCAALQAGFAKVGIIALVDEATGYQDERASDELQKLLEAYVVEEMRPYVPRFPTEFFKQLYKVRGWEFREGNHRHPQLVGKLINEWVYKRLPDPVLPKLQELNPVVEKRRRHKHHQFLTDNTGVPHLDKQITSVITLMKAAGGNYQMFEQLLVNAFPKHGENLRLGLRIPEPEQV